MSNEYDLELFELTHRYLPPSVFVYEFTREFVDVWKDECQSGEERFDSFASGLDRFARQWFDEILMNSSRMQPGGMTPMEILKDFIRLLWCDELSRRRGLLPANGGMESDLERMKLTLTLKRLQQSDWEEAKTLIRVV